MLHIAVSGETPTIPEGVSEAGRDFLTCCWMRDKQRRPTCDTLLLHPFVADAKSPREARGLAVGTSIAGRLHAITESPLRDDVPADVAPSSRCACPTCSHCHTCAALQFPTSLILDATIADAAL